MRGSEDGKQAIDRLREAEAKADAWRHTFQRFFDTAFETILIANDEGHLLDANAAACVMLGQSREEILRLRIPEITGGKWTAQFEVLWRRFLTEGIQAGDYTLVRGDGSTVEVEYRARANVVPGWHVATLHDVTERHRKIEGLERAQRVARVGHWEWDVAHDMALWSDECFRITGVTPSAGTKKLADFTALVHPEDRTHLETTMREALLRGEPYELDFRLLRADGSERIVHEQADVERDADGKPVRLIGTIQDVTEQRRTGQEREALIRKLAEEKSWLRAVFERSPIGLMMHENANPPRVTVNPAGEELSGARIQDAGALSDVLTRVYRPDGTPIPELEIPLVRALRSGENVVGYELLVEKPDGTKTNLISSAHPVFDADGAILGAVTTSVDITAQKELERLREEWTSIVAHDLRQPVTTILATAAHLARSLLEPGAKTKAERIRKSAERLIRMTDDLADLSRLDAHRLELVRVPTSLPPLLRQIVDDMTDDEAHGRVWLSMEQNIPMVSVDPARFHQVVENLLSNAKKYGSPKTPIRIKLEARGGEVVVSVCNEGPGIPPELLPRLFSRFQRGSVGASRIKGLGLGLYICRGLVEAHGGRITVESEPGETTTFSFTLPKGD